MDWFFEEWEEPPDFYFSGEWHDLHTGQHLRWDDKRKLWVCDACLMAAPNHHDYCALA